MNKELDDEQLFDIFYQIVDTVIEIKEVDPDEKYRNDVYKTAISHMDALLSQIDKKLDQCEDENDKIFVKETTLNFLIFTLKKLLANYDFPLENIEFVANHLKTQILQLKTLNNLEDK